MRVYICKSGPSAGESEDAYRGWLIVSGSSVVVWSQCVRCRVAKTIDGYLFFFFLDRPRDVVVLGEVVACNREARWAGLMHADVRWQEIQVSSYSQG